MIKLRFGNRRNPVNKRGLQTFDVNLKNINSHLIFVLGLFFGSTSLSVCKEFYMSLKYTFWFHLNIFKPQKKFCNRVHYFPFHFSSKIILWPQLFVCRSKSFHSKAFRFIVHINLTVPVKVIDK